MDFNEGPDPQQQQQQQSQQPLFHIQQQENIIADDDIEIEMNRNNQENNDIDSSFLQQFSCLGTTDHEDLINELVKIMNNQMSRESAKFFLEMSNWNLHAAIGCYMDLWDLTNLPSMKVVGQKQLSDNAQVYQLKNVGNEAWPSGCYLSSPGQTKRLEIPNLQPGETCEILAELPPTTPPLCWKLYNSKGHCFGDKLWMVPNSDATYDLAQRMSQLCTNTSASQSSENCPQINIHLIFKNV